jgi:endonuclease IV
MGCISKDDESGLKCLVNFFYSKKIPMILETPHGDNDMYEVYDRELNKIKEWLAN